MDARPSPTELAILKHLWKSGPQSAREIHDGVKTTLAWSYSSTRKTLDRMAEKNLVTTEDMHGLKVYGAGVAKVATLSRLMRDFAAQVLDLESPLPVTAFATSPLLDANDLEELERLLDENGETDQ